MKGLPTAPFPAISISCHLSKPDLSQAGQSPEEIGVCLLRERRVADVEHGMSGNGNEIAVPLQAFLCEMDLDRSL